jgi:RecA-family ATPase
LALFRLIRFKDLKLSTDPEYLIEGLFPRSGLAVVWGEPKDGKSLWMMDAMLHVALGWEYRGRKVQQGLVVYCAFEGQSGYPKRKEAFQRHHSFPDDVQVPFYLVPARMDFVADHGKLIRSIRKEIGDTKPVAVVLDTLNRSLAGSESKDEDMASPCLMSNMG